ncbi:MAG: class I SAM-dependent methyltransferase [Planctomycetota bacterium]
MIRGEPFWAEAQAKEIEVWRERGCARSDFLARRAAVLDAWLGLWKTPEHRRVLEIGGAGLPLVESLRGYEDRHAIDPLMDDYVRLFRPVPSGPEVVRRRGRAEELPYPAQHFDTVIMLNVLDHVQEPQRALAEIRRVLRRDIGLFLFSCDTYSRLWLTLRACRVALRGRRRNDLLHPHHFTALGLLRRLTRHFRALEVHACYGDPLAEEHGSRQPYPFGGVRNRLKREGRLYVTARPWAGMA